MMHTRRSKRIAIKKRAVINWTDVRERLARAHAATATVQDLPPERVRTILAERARLLARAPAPTPTAGDTIDVITFALGTERYAIETKYVREVERLVGYTPVPGAPDFLLGVTNLRGEVLCVIDLRPFFNVPNKGLTDLSRVIVVGATNAEFGILADQTYEIATLRTTDIVSSQDPMAGIGREYLVGVTRDALIVLDGAALLGDPRLFIDQSDPGAA